MVQIRVNIQYNIYKALEPIRKIKTWDTIVNEALALYLTKNVTNPMNKYIATIVSRYYDIKSFLKVYNQLKFLLKTLSNILEQERQYLDQYDTTLLEFLLELERKLKEAVNEIENARKEVILEEVSNE
jgi:CII-binding regulator of phage lambda lysogenization HflD